MKTFSKIAFAMLLLAPMGVAAQEGEQEAEQQDVAIVASWNQGVIEGGTWTAFGNVVIENYTGKYNSNKSTISCMTFTSSLSYADGTFNNALKLEGDFLAGDVVTLQPFTVMSTNDFTGGSKYANLVIKDANNVELYSTGGTAAEKTVTDGHEEAGDPKEFSYMLAEDQTELYFGRQGNTRINCIKIVVERAKGESTGIETVHSSKSAANSYYDLQGRQMNSKQLKHGIYIVNGKKVVR